MVEFREKKKLEPTFIKVELIVQKLRNYPTKNPDRLK